MRQMRQYIRWEGARGQGICVLGPPWIRGKYFPDMSLPSCTCPGPWAVRTYSDDPRTLDGVNATSVGSSKYQIGEGPTTRRQGTGASQAT